MSANKHGHSEKSSTEAMDSDLPDSLPSSWSEALSGWDGPCDGEQVQKKQRRENTTAHPSDAVQTSAMGVSLLLGTPHAPPSSAPPTIVERSVLSSKRLQPLSAVCIDVETTGIAPTKDEIISIAVVELLFGAAGHNQWVLSGRSFHRLVKPTKKVSSSAYRVHKLTSKVLERQPPFAAILPDLAAFLSDVRSGSTSTAAGDIHYKGPGGTNNVECVPLSSGGAAATVSVSRPSFQVEGCAAKVGGFLTALQSSCRNNRTLVFPPVIAHNAAFDRNFLYQSALRNGWEVVWDKQSPLTCTMSMFRALYPECPTNLTKACSLAGIDAAGREDRHEALQDAQLCGHLFIYLTEAWKSCSKRDPDNTETV